MKSRPEQPPAVPTAKTRSITSASGQVYQGTRNIGLGANPALYGNYGAVTAQETIANSNYNALETNLRYAGKRTTVLLGYTYAKSIDQGSNLGEELNPFNPALSRAISSWDMRHNFVATYKYTVPFDRLFGRANRAHAGLGHFRHHALQHRLSGHALRRFGQLAPRHARQRRQQSAARHAAIHDRPAAHQYQPAQRPARIQHRAFRAGIARAVGQRAPQVLLRTRHQQLRRAGHQECARSPKQNRSTFASKPSTSSITRSSTAPAAVDGEVNDPTFGHVVSAADPRLIQLAAKLYF